MLEQRTNSLKDKYYFSALFFSMDKNKTMSVLFKETPRSFLHQVFEGIYFPLSRL